VVVNGTTLASQGEKPDAVNEAILGFLALHTSQTAGGVV
jgi:hypothetical protein